MIETRFLTHHETLTELLSLVNNGDWELAYDKAIEWQNQIESILLTRFCEPNKVHEDFEILKIRLKKRAPYNIKTKEVREAIANILDKVSEFGIAIGKNKVTEDSVLIAHKIENLMRLIDNSFANILTTPSSAVKQKYQWVESIKDHIYHLEQTIKSYKPKRHEIKKMINYILSDIAEFKSSINMLLITDKEKSMDPYTRFVDSVNKIVDVINANSDEDVDALLEVFEYQRNVDLGRSATTRTEEYYSDKSDMQIFTGELPDTGGIDWVDEEWEKILQHPRVFLIIGHKGGGKSALGWAMLEYYAKKHGLKAYLVNMSGKRVPPEKLRLLPKWITVIDDPEQVPNNCVVLFDEAHLRWHARTTYGAEAPKLDKLIELARQKEQSMIYVVQQSSKLDKNIVDAIDALFIKYMTTFRVAGEREGIKEFTEKARKKFEKILGKDDVRKYVYIISQNPSAIFEGMKKNGLASFWNEEISKFYAGW